MSLKLNDPFGRVSKRNQRDYASLRDRFRQEGIRDAQGVKRIAENMTATAVRVVLLVLGISIAAALFFPQALAILVALNVLILLWGLSVYLKTRLHLKRYVREECDGTQEDPPTGIS